MEVRVNGAIAINAVCSVKFRAFKGCFVMMEDDSESVVGFSADERIVALLENAEVNTQVVNELVIALKKISSADSEYIERIDERSKMVLNNVEEVAKRIYLNNEISKEEVMRVINESVARAVVMQLNYALTIDLKEVMGEKIGEMVDEIFEQSTGTNKSKIVSEVLGSQSDIEGMKSDIEGMKSDLVAVRNETISTVMHINKEVKAGVESVIGESIEGFKSGCEGSISGLNRTVLLINNAAKEAQSKSQLFFDNMSDFNKQLEMRVYWFSGVFCAVFMVSMIILFTVIYNINVPSEKEIQERKDKLQVLSEQQKRVNEVMKARSVKYSQEYSAILIKIDKSQCENDYCRVKNQYEN